MAYKMHFSDKKVLSFITRTANQKFLPETNNIGTGRNGETLQMCLLGLERCESSHFATMRVHKVVTRTQIIIRNLAVANRLRSASCKRQKQHNTIAILVVLSTVQPTQILKSARRLRSLLVGSVSHGRSLRRLCKWFQ